jgi:Tfp pilus assembly protein PilF
VTKRHKTGPQPVRAGRRAGSTSRSRTSHSLWPGIAVFVVAAVVRLIVATQIADLPLSRTPHYDSLEYLSWARRIAAGDFTWPAPPPHGPGYPYFLGALLALSGGRSMVIALVQSIMGAFTCLLAAETGAAWFGRRAGVAAGFILALYAPLVWIDASIYSEGLLIFLMTTALWCVATNRHPAITGVVIGLAALVRPTALILLPLLLIAGARAWRARAILIAVAAAVIAPVTIANWRAMHQWIPIQSAGGMNFYLGNSPTRDGLPSARPGGDWDRIEPDAARHGAMSPVAEDRYFTQKTIAEIRQHPGAFLKLLGRKLVWTFQSEEIRDTHSFYFFRRAVPLLWLLSFTILFALAAAGAFLADWRSRGAWIVAAYVALTAATCIGLVVASRYRMPIVVGLALFAGIVIESFPRKPRRLAIAVAIALVAGFATRVWSHPPSHNFAEELALTSESLTKERNDAEAERAARQAIAIDPRNALGYDALGLVLGASNRTSDAAEAFARATALNPDFVAAHLHRGQVYAQMQNLDGAAAEYARATALDPHDSDALLALARLQGATGRSAEGLQSAQRAVALRDPSAEDWLLIAALAADARHFDVASNAIQRAGAAGAPQPFVMFATALLRYREGHLREAAQIVDQVIARAPEFTQAQQLRAEIERAKQK